MANSKILIPTVAMVVIIAASNYLVEFPISEWLTWGAFTYPFAFLVTELTNRFYGALVAKKVVYRGFAVAVLLAFSFMNRRIALASSLAFLISQLLDIAVFNRFRRGAWWLAPGVASVVASFIDTVLFFSIAFAGSQVPWVKLAAGDFAVKLAMDLCMLLPFRFFLWFKFSTINKPNN